MPLKHETTGVIVGVGVTVVVGVLVVVGVGVGGVPVRVAVGVGVNVSVAVTVGVGVGGVPVRVAVGVRVRVTVGVRVMVGMGFGVLVFILIGVLVLKGTIILGLSVAVLLFSGVSEGSPPASGVFEAVGFLVAVKKGAAVGVSKTLVKVGRTRVGVEEETGLVKSPTTNKPKTNATNKIPPINKKISKKITSPERPRGVVRGGLEGVFINLYAQAYCTVFLGFFPIQLLGSRSLPDKIIETIIVASR